MEKIQAITVAQLYQECARQIKAGNGNRHIIISGDDEGNSFHQLFFGFTTDMDFSEPCMACCLPWGLTPEEVEKEYITLG